MYVFWIRIVRQTNNGMNFLLFVELFLKNRNLIHEITNLSNTLQVTSALTQFLYLLYQKI